jgi:4-amino-4-deoxy-L-arabinose transferase-like glycosyltransferase
MRISYSSGFRKCSPIAAHQYGHSQNSLNNGARASSSELPHSEAGQPSRSAASWRTLLALLAATVVLRFPALVSYPFCIDESYYSAGAAELVSGATFFRDVVDHKPPGIYLIYAFIYRLAGVFNLAAVHVVLLLVAALTAYLVGLVAQNLFGARPGRWAGMLYAAASVVGPANDFQAANTELFMNLPLVAAFLLATRTWVRKGTTHAESLAMGVLVGVAVLIRPQAVWVLLPIGVVLIRRRVGPLAVALSAAGAVLPLLALTAWLWRTDALVDAAASLAYARTYTNSLAFETKLANGTLKTLFFVAIDLGLVIPAVAMMVRGRRRDVAWQRGAGCMLVTWLLVSFVAVGMGGRFYPHYFIQVLPPLAVVAARQLTSWRPEVS